MKITATIRSTFQQTLPMLPDAHDPCSPHLAFSVPAPRELKIDQIARPNVFALPPAPVVIDPVSISLDAIRVKSIGCLLPAGVDLLARATPPHIAKPDATIPTALQLTPKQLSSKKVLAKSATRIRPPRDLVKLEDRLQFLLQPPLESLLASEGLRFAHHPFPYQLDGIAFLYPRHEAVLADEMGLGKTMQAISSVRLLVHHGQLQRVLLICPKPLVANWQREFALWASELPITVIEGPQARRHYLWRLKAALLTITNYETIVRDRDCLNELAGEFDLILLDEAQRIKNRGSATSQAVNSISRKRSWALTGTPIENRADDLVGIFDFVMPGHLHSDMKPRELRTAVADHILRRTKDRVLTDLPPKLFRDADLQLTPQQRATYELAEQDGVVHLNELEQNLSIQHVFELIIRLKQICNFDPGNGDSSKLERLEADLEECAASGRKALVFSQWVETLDRLGEKLQRFKPLAYHGRIPQKQRNGIIEQFRNDKESSVLLMSYGAGGVGLNLQFASYVFLFDRWWNPAVEDQAINRAHRIGSEGPVTVTRFLTMDTIEERINQILEEKRALFDSIFGDDFTGKSASLSRDEVFSLFNLPSPAKKAA